MVPIDPHGGDRTFPQLPLVTDCGRMKELFQQRLPGLAGGPLRVDSLEVTALRHTPGKRCRVSYRLSVYDTESGDTTRQLLEGEITPRGEASARYAESARELLCEPSFGPAVHLLPDLEMVVWGFPNGPSLKGLPRLWHPELFAEFVAEHRADLGLPQRAGVDDVAAELVKYVPGDRCTFRHRIRLADGREWVLFSKTFAESDDAERVYRTMRAIHDSEASHSGRVRIPEPLYFDRRLATVFTPEVPGENADDLLCALDARQVGADAGAFLAALHGIRIDGLPEASDHHTLSRLARARETFDDAGGDRARRVRDVVQQLERDYSKVTTLSPRTIHGAFRLSQLLIHDGRLALLDFEDFTIGNPVRDVAAFVAHLLYIPWKDRLSLDDGLVWIRSFCRGYAAAAPWGLPADTLHWYTSAHLVGKHARRCIQKNKKNAMNTVDQLLGLSEELVAGRRSLW